MRRSLRSAVSGRRVWDGLSLVGNSPATDPPRFLGGYQRQVCACNGSIRESSAGNRRLDPDHAHAYAVRKSPDSRAVNPFSLQAGRGSGEGASCCPWCSAKTAELAGINACIVFGLSCLPQSHA
jgi:hypothetical protein